MPDRLTGAVVLSETHSRALEGTNSSTPLAQRNTCVLLGAGLVADALPHARDWHFTVAADTMDLEHRTSALEADFTVWAATSVAAGLSAADAT
jgi:hypothetical protein